MISVEQVLAMSVRELVSSDVATAMEAVRVLYEGGDRLSSEKLAAVQTLAAHLNNEWPEELQVLLEELLRSTGNENKQKSIDELQLEAFWMALCIRKLDFWPRTGLWKDFFSAIPALDKSFGVVTEPDDIVPFLQSMVGNCRSKSPADRTFGLLNLSAVYYAVKKRRDQALKIVYQGFMREALLVAAEDADSHFHEGALAVLFVHSEGIDGLNFEEARTLVEARHLGWLSYWHLFQISDDVLRRLSKVTLKCTDRATEVLTALVAKRLS